MTKIFARAIFFLPRSQNFETEILIQPEQMQKDLVFSQNPVDEFLKSGVMLSNHGSSDTWFRNWQANAKANWSALQVPEFAKTQLDIAAKEIALKTIPVLSKDSDIHVFSRWDEDNENLQEGTIVIVPVRGMMVRGESWMTRYGYATSTEYLDRVTRELDENPNVSAIIFDVNSGGGIGYGNQRLSKTIQSAGTTTVLFYQTCASAALEAFKSCDYIIANEDDSRIGSYGSYFSMTFVSDEGLKEYGYKRIEVYAPQSTEKNIEVRDAKKGDTAKMEDMLRKSVDFMIADMNEQRPLNSDEWQTGKLFNANEAIEIGLTDQILSINETITFLRNILPSPASNNLGSALGMVNF